MNDALILSPPVAFVIVLAVVAGMAWVFSPAAFKRKIQPEGLTKPYACGEDAVDHMIQPDYAQFFPFAFFFTILHVVALMATTVPVNSLGSLTMGALYLAAAAVGLLVLYRR